LNERRGLEHQTDFLLFQKLPKTGCRLDSGVELVGWMVSFEDSSGEEVAFA
jgi:hypothetical protein